MLVMGLRRRSGYPRAIKAGSEHTECGDSRRCPVGPARVGAAKINESKKIRVDMDGVKKLPRVKGPCGRSPLLLCGLVLLANLIAFIGCADFLSSRDNDIRESTQAIETA